MTRFYLKHRITFQERQVISDAYGNERGAFVDQFTRWADIHPSLGLETVTAARLEGHQPVNITVIRDDSTLRILADWRATDIEDGREYAIQSPTVDLDDNKLYLTMTATAGAAA